MEKYGLERGIRGSEARHKTTPQYSRELHAKNEDLKEDIADLEERKQEVNDKIRNMYDHRDEAKEKFLAMHEFNKQKESEIAQKEQRLEQLQRDYEPYEAQDDLNLIREVFPETGARTCELPGSAVV
jgi:chromosome segregation ATPase